jgi:tetratricopeptide (TPR) repeat protein
MMSKHCFFWAVLLGLGVTSFGYAQRDKVPSIEYERAFDPYFAGDYPTALQAFRSAARGGVRSTEGLWVDSICYHAMMAECLYRMGDLPNALDQCNTAIKLASFHNEWLLRIQFPDTIEPSASSVRNTITWGVSTRNTRLARVPDKMLSFQGRMDNLEVIQRGGVVAAPQLYPLNAKEVVRCTALALRRRREILGPVGPSDPATGQILATFAHYATPPNHWSQSWTSCFAGLALASAGKFEQAAPELVKALLIGGMYDHELTALALVELGKLTFEQGQYQLAAGYFLEATFAAAAFDQYDILEDAFRGALITHMVSGQKGLYAPLGPASEWARRYSRGLQGGLLLLAAENCAAQGQLPQSVKLLNDVRQSLGTRGVKSGLMAARYNYLSAQVAFAQGNAAGHAELAAALAFQKNSSLRLFQIGLADTLFTSGAITQRVADGLFSDVLREPTASDWNVDPLETLSVVVTPHPLPLENWFSIASERKDTEKMLDISERIRRHRFYSTLPLGGRTLALRWILEAPELALTQAARLQRTDLLNRYPVYAKASVQSAELRKQLAELPLAPAEKDETTKQRKLFEQLAAVSSQQEFLLQQIALRREPSEFVFPPLLTVKEIQARIPEGQLVLAYLVTRRNVTAFALSRDKYAAWPVDKPTDVSKGLSELLKQFGLSEKKLGVTASLLKDQTWQVTGGKLLRQLTANRIETWEPYRELVVIPDGLLWYIPFEALCIGDGDNRRPLIATLRVRYAPTLGLANIDFGGQTPQARTAVIVGKLLATADAEASAQACQAIQAKLPQTSRFDNLPVPSSVFTAACDRLVVLSELDPNPRSVYGWSPTAVERGKAGSSLEEWLTLPWQSPGELVLPGFHTPAETGLKRGTGSGNELFLNACALMGTGAHSVLLSRWPTAGQSAFDLIGEYVQELPFLSAAEAWKRSVELAADRQVDPELEPRVDKTGWDDKLKTDHPFFWAGYLLIDTGSRPKSGDDDVPAKVKASPDPPKAKAAPLPQADPQAKVDPPPKVDPQPQPEPPPKVAPRPGADPKPKPIRPRR